MITREVWGVVTSLDIEGSQEESSLDKALHSYRRCGYWHVRSYSLCILPCKQWFTVLVVTYYVGLVILLQQCNVIVTALYKFHKIMPNWCTFFFHLYIFQKRYVLLVISIFNIHSSKTDNYIYTESLSIPPIFLIVQWNHYQGMVKVILC